MATQQSLRAEAFAAESFHVLGFGCAFPTPNQKAISQVRHASYELFGVTFICAFFVGQRHRILRG
jgi:hypothetical protein